MMSEENRKETLRNLKLQFQNFKIQIILIGLNLLAPEIAEPALIQ
jgi:hypothetical protein